MPPGLAAAHHHTTGQQSYSHVDATSNLRRVDKVNMASRPGHVLVSFVIGSGATHGEGELGIGMGKRGI